MIPGQDNAACQRCTIKIDKRIAELEAQLRPRDGTEKDEGG
jgi:hypothetical protein